MLVRAFNLKTFTTRGPELTPLELKDHVPFAVQRIYWITKPAGQATSQHCHFMEEEVFICLAGRAVMQIDQGNGLEEIELMAPNACLHIPTCVWHGFTELSDDAVVLAVSSTNYSADRSDYCEDYQQFLDKHRPTA